MDLKKIVNNVTAANVDVPDDIKRKFVGILASLSPENLFMDGEATKSMAAARKRQLMQHWKQLEQKLGRKVSENEVSVWMTKGY